MWKKLLVGVLALVGSFSVVYTYYNLQLNANSYNIGGSVYGQIGSPTLLDRVYLGTKATTKTDETGKQLTGGNVGWVLLADYSIPNTTTGFKGSNSYFAMSTSPIDYTTVFKNVNDIPIHMQDSDLTITALWESYDIFNTRLENNTQDMKIVAPKNIEWYSALEAATREFLADPITGIEALRSQNKHFDEIFPGINNINQSRAMNTLKIDANLRVESYGIMKENNIVVGKKNIYPLSGSAITSDGVSLCNGNISTCPWNSSTAPKLPAIPFDYNDQWQGMVVNGDKTFDYYAGISVSDQVWRANTAQTYRVANFWINQPSANGFFGGGSTSFGTIETPVLGDAKYVRPAIELKKDIIDSVIFSLGQATESGQGVVGVRTPVKKIAYYNTEENMKLRIYEPTMQVSFEDIIYDGVSIYTKQNITKTEVATVPNTGTFTFKVNGNSGANSFGTNTISALILDDTGKLIAYAPLGTTKDGSNTYNLDFGELPFSVGKTYTIKVVNEKYNTDLTEVSPADCSELSEGFSVKVVAPLMLDYTPTYNETTSTGTPYEFSSNVMKNDTIGHVTSRDGDASNTINIIQDPDYITDGHDDDWMNFQLSSTSVPANSVAVVIKSDAPDLKQNSLKAGTYYFRIQGYDSGGNEEAFAKVNVKLTVNKTLPTLSFTKADTTYVKIGSSPISETITTNNDELDMSDQKGASYTIGGGVTGTGLDVKRSTNNAHEYQITIDTTSSAILPSTFQLNVSLPETDNYLATEEIVQKDIYVYKGLENLIWTPAKTGDFSIKDVENGNVIGTLLATGGLPNYTYTMASSSDDGFDADKAKDNSKFTIDPTPLAAGSKAEVKTTTSLGAGTYKIQMKVEDDPKDIKLVDAIITVSANAQAALKFKEDNKDITTKTIYFDDQNITVQAEGGETSITSLPTYTYSDQTDKSYMTIKDNGNGTATLTPVKVTESGKTIKVKATKAGNTNFAEVSTELEVTILPAKQTVAFDNTDNPRKIKLDETGVKETASGVLTSKGTKGSGIGGITYTSADDSIASIDPSTGEITPHKNGTVAITATLNKDGTDDYNGNYETATATKNIYIYEGMTITWKPVTPNLKASGTASAGEKAGSVIVTNNTGSVTYAPVTDTSIAKNVDGGLFTIDALGNVKLKNAITASALHTHGNLYKLQVEVTDDNGTQTENIEITIDPADNDFYFVNPDDLNKINKIERTYSGTTFQLATKNSNGGTVTYQLKDGQDESIITVESDGTVTMNKVGGPVLVEATVIAGSGYAGKTIEIPVTISKATYTIAWQKPTTTYVKYTEDVSVEEKAVLTPTGALAYEPLTKDICDIDVNGTVTALKEGTCEIKATSTNPNFTEISSTKEIIFFTGAQGTFTQTNIPQAESASIGTTIGTTQIIGLDDTSDYKYTINLDSNNKNTDSSLFQVSADYGTVSLKQAISADTLKTKIYDENKGGYPLLVQVVAKNDITGDQTIIDCEVIIKGAKMSDVSFKDHKGISQEWKLHR